MPALDDTDRRILNSLRLNARIINSDLAEEVGLSPSACLRRVRLLEQSGVIRGYTTIVAGGSPEEGIIASVQVEPEGQSEEYLLPFEAGVRRPADTQAWFLVTGEGASKLT